MAAKPTAARPRYLLVVDAVAISIVQCLATADDALAFLTSMPASTLSAPLAALLVLLRAPNVLATWPVICLEHIDSVYQSLALAALPALPGIRICWYRGLQEVLGNRYSSLGAFLTTWPNKLQSIENAIFSAYFDEIKHALPLYPRLTDVDVRVKHCMALLPWLPPSVRTLHLTGTYSRARRRSIPATPLLHWLQSSNVTSLDLVGIFSHGDAIALAAVLAQASSLRSVSLVDSDALLRAIFVAQKSLHHLTSFVVSTRDSASVEHLMLHVLDLSALTRLDVHCNSNLSWLLKLLPAMRSLNELALRGGYFHSVPAPSMHDRLRILTLEDVQTATKADATALRHWMNGLHTHCAINFRTTTIANDSKRSHPALSPDAM